MNNKLFFSILIPYITFSLVACTPSPKQRLTALESPSMISKKNIIPIPPNSSSQTTNAAITVAIPEENSTHISYPDIVLTFLEALKNRDTTTISSALGLFNKNYTFLENVTIDSYMISLLNSPLDQRFATSHQYEITLSVTQSNSSLFPLGTSKWLLAISNDFSQIELFIPYEQILFESASTHKHLAKNFSNYNHLYDIATTFSAATGIFDTTDIPMNQLPITHAILHHLLHATPTTDTASLTVNDFKSYITSNYNLTLSEATFESYIHYLNKHHLLKDNDIQVIDLSKCAHGESYYICMLDCVEALPNGNIILYIQYYSDTCFFYPSKKVAYIFEPTSTNQLKLCNVETLETSSYEPILLGI